MTDRKYFTILVATGALIWTLLQITVSAASPMSRPEPIRYTATIGVSVTADNNMTIITGGNNG